MVKAVVVVLGFVCDYLRDLRETLGFPLCGLIEYSCVLFSRRLRRLRRRMQLAALYRRERQVGMVKAVVVVLGFVCDYLRDLRENKNASVLNIYPRFLKYISRRCFFSA